MSFTYLERQELNRLSKEILGKSSRWYNNAYKRGVKRFIRQLAPKAREYVIEWLISFDDVKNYLLKAKEAQDKIMADIKAKGTQTKV